MVIHLNRSEWLTAAAQAALAASRGAGSDCLTGIHMAADSRRMLLTLTATNHEIAIQASLRAVVEQPGQVVLNAALLPALLARLPEEQVTLEQATASQVTIRSGTAVYVLSTPPAAQYPLPELPFPEDTVTVSGLHTLARSTLFVTEKGSGQPLFQCVCLTLGPNGLTATGTNGFCIVEAEGDRNSKGSACPRPQNTGRHLSGQRCLPNGTGRGGNKRGVLEWDHPLFRPPDGGAVPGHCGDSPPLCPGQPGLCGRLPAERRHPGCRFPHRSDLPNQTDRRAGSVVGRGTDPAGRGRDPNRGTDGGPRCRRLLLPLREAV